MAEPAASRVAAAEAIVAVALPVTLAVTEAGTGAEGHRGDSGDAQALCPPTSPADLATAWLYTRVVVVAVAVGTCFQQLRAVLSVHKKKNNNNNKTCVQKTETAKNTLWGGLNSSCPFFLPEVFHKDLFYLQTDSHNYWQAPSANF
jgi:hypothetical protein